MARLTKDLWEVKWSEVAPAPLNNTQFQQFEVEQDAIDFNSLVGEQNPITPIQKEYYTEEEKMQLVFRLTGKETTEELKQDYNILAKHLGLKKDSIYEHGELIRMSYFQYNSDLEIYEPVVIEEKRYTKNYFGIYTKVHTDIFWYYQNGEVGYEIIDDYGKDIDPVLGMKMLKDRRTYIIDKAKVYFTGYIIAILGTELGFSKSLEFQNKAMSYLWTDPETNVQALYNTLSTYTDGDGRPLVHFIENSQESYMNIILGQRPNQENVLTDFTIKDLLKDIITYVT